MVWNKLKYTFRKALKDLSEQLAIERKQQEELHRVQFRPILDLATTLMEQLKIDEDSFHFIAGISHKDARSYFLYTVASEVLKGCMSGMRTHGWVVDGEEEEKYSFGFLKKKNRSKRLISEKRVMHLIHEGVVDEQEGWFRKMQECLCDLLCFSQSNEQEYFRLYIAAHELVDILYANSDLKEFFGHEMENFSWQARDLLQICSQLHKKLDPSKCWFLKESISFDNKTHPKTIVKSIKQRFQNAMLLANASEKTVLGPTYKVGYGGTSRSMHPKIDAPIREINFDGTLHAISKVSLIALSVLNRAYSLANLTPPAGLKRILDLATNAEEAEKGLHLHTVRDLGTGDLMSTSGDDVAEILDIEETKYGYRCYRVKYLHSPGIKGIAEEWCPPRYLGVCLLKRRDIRQFYNQNIKKLFPTDIAAKLDEWSDEKMFEYAKKTILEMARQGHLKTLRMETGRRPRGEVSKSDGVLRL